jgi:hypothetical protein
MAAVAYGHLPAVIPSGWIGWAQPGGTYPAGIVFLAFPGAQVLIVLFAWVSRKDREGHKVAQFGKVINLALLTLVFTMLQSSVFTIPR